MLAAWLAAAIPLAAAEDHSDPSMKHGAGQVITGVLTEFPKTVVQATMDGPPVVGTAVGILAGVSRALQKTVGGVVEMSQAFDPWGINKRRRR